VTHDPLEDLTPLEWQIFVRMTGGIGTREIADQLKVDERMVQECIQAIWSAVRHDPRR
jgi:DNA-binding NarL/FixJ family response regulator